ncbi:winged helix-turn-helix transcriptional regulator [Actinophytocola gossypii]|uniref:Helix-turn-helix transcriptional regulator n=1 Tax=Actinophytocola gossypii TaxID=2812003 RepID=A0ABT2J431_9PSEU|nr:helix-turn-helix domain-containing protein [Actinophytocola gossypii]MCT2582628.1 helix-turn-helix transcriptional regulator [Actinophytocola gossypii]
MRRTSFARWPCSIARTMDLLGDQWTLLVLREAFHGVRRFDQFQAALGIARNTLTERLDRLTGAGLLARVRYQDRPARYEYPLTEMGRDFFPALAAIIRWGDTWLDGGAGPPALLHHLDCDHPTEAAVNCARCGVELTADRVRFEPGPGLATVEGHR